MAAAPVIRAILRAACLLVVLAATARAQVPTPTLPVDSAAADTIPVATDTIPAAPATVPAPADTVGRPPGAAGDSLPADSLGEGERTVPPDPEADAIMAELRRLPGFTPTEYIGNRAIYRTSEGVLRLIGDAQVEREGNRINADSII